MVRSLRRCDITTGIPREMPMEFVRKARSVRWRCKFSEDLGESYAEPNGNYGTFNPLR